jgi:hypothetical protein
MLLISEFKRNFGSQVVPDVLLELFDFQNTIPDSLYYSQGFSLQVIENQGISTYSENEVFLNSLFEFAQADSTGSTYTIWAKKPETNLNHAPIVVFGSEGGFHVVAKDMLELLQILTFDTEPLIDWEKVLYYKENSEFVPSLASAKYIQWVRYKYQIQPVNEVDSIVRQAQYLYQEEFVQWMQQYYTE